MSGKMKEPKALLLDFYGTLVEEEEGPILKVCREIAEAARRTVTWEQIADEWRRIFPSLCFESYGDKFQFEREMERKTVEILLELYEAELDSGRIIEELYHHWERPAVFSETNDVLAKCSLPVCIVSNVDNDALKAALQFSGLSFDLIVTSEDCRSYKPRPETFVRALELLDMRNEEVLHVGDSLFTDVKGASSLGIPTLWINRQGRELTEEDIKPDCIAKDLTALNQRS